MHSLNLIERDLIAYVTLTFLVMDILDYNERRCLYGV